MDFETLCFQCFELITRGPSRPAEPDAIMDKAIAMAHKIRAARHPSLDDGHPQFLEWAAEIKELAGSQVSTAKILLEIHEEKLRKARER